MNRIWRSSLPCDYVEFGDRNTIYFSSSSFSYHSFFSGLLNRRSSARMADFCVKMGVKNGVELAGNNETLVNDVGFPDGAPGGRPRRSFLRNEDTTVARSLRLIVGSKSGCRKLRCKWSGKCISRKPRRLYVFCFFTSGLFLTSEASASSARSSFHFDCEYFFARLALLSPRFIFRFFGFVATLAVSIFRGAPLLGAASLLTTVADTSGFNIIICRSLGFVGSSFVRYFNGFLDSTRASREVWRVS